MERLDYPIGDKDNGQVVQISRSINALPIRGAGLPVPSLDFLWLASYNGWIFATGDADQDDKVTAQTSFANTSPTWAIDVPAGYTVIPLYWNLSQTGTVAGGAIDVIFEIDNVKRFSSGTAEKAFNSNFKTARSGVYSTVTAVAGYGATVFQATIGPDVSPAEGAVPGPFWKPDYPILLKGPASLLIYTYAAVTAPTWFWNGAFVELTNANAEALFGPYLAD